MRDLMRHGALALAGCLVLACGRSKTEQPVQTTTESGKTTSPSGVSADRRGTTLIRMVNAVPGKQALDVAADTKLLFTSVGYQDVTDFQELRDNVAQFTVRPAGKDTLLAENKEVVGDGARYTLVALPDEKGNIQLRVLRDELVTDPAKTKLRVINAAPGMADVKVTVQGKDTPLFSGIALGTEAGYQDVEPMTATLVFQPKEGAPLRLDKVKLEPGRAYTIVLTGAAGHKTETVRFDDRLVRTGRQVSLRP